MLALCSSQLCTILAQQVEGEVGLGSLHTVNSSSYGEMLLSSSSGEGSGGGPGGGSPPPVAGCIRSNGSSSNSIDALPLSVTARCMQQPQHQQQPPPPQAPRGSPSPNSFMMMPQQNLLATNPNTAHVVGSSNPPQPPYNISSDNNSLDPLSYFLTSGHTDDDPFGFGVGSVADGTFGGRKPTPEELLLFRSHRLLQAQAVGVAIGGRSKTTSSSPDAAHVHKRFGLVSAALARQMRMKVLEQTNAAVECVRALGPNALPTQQEDVIDVERRNCHRMLAGILDAATSTLREIVETSSCGGSLDGMAGGMVSTVGQGLALQSSLLSSPVTESQQVKERTPKSYEYYC